MPDLIITGVCDGKKIQAIKGLRVLTGFGLKESKGIIDDVCSGQPYNAGPYEPSARLRMTLNEHALEWSFRDPRSMFTITMIWVRDPIDGYAWLEEAWTDDQIQENPDGWARVIERVREMTSKTVTCEMRFQKARIPGVHELFQVTEVDAVEVSDG